MEEYETFKRSTRVGAAQAEARLPHLFAVALQAVLGQQWTDLFFEEFARFRRRIVPVNRRGRVDSVFSFAIGRFKPHTTACMFSHYSIKLTWGGSIRSIQFHGMVTKGSEP